MPVVEHENFETVDDATPIYKYMNFYKFSSLISTSKLFFSKVTNFSDPMEGCYPRKLYAFSKERWLQIYKNNKPELDDKELSGIANSTFNYLRSVYQMRDQFAVCCFCSEQHEYEALWRLYSSLSFGVCIKSTFGRLKSALKFNNEIAIHLGRVNYISEEEASWGDKNILGNIFWPYINKRQEYKTEQEIRAVLWEGSNHEGNGIQSFNSKKGSFVDVVIKDLIEEIILSPTSDEDFRSAVLSMLKKANLDSLTVTKSKLFGKPF